jgi:hypothetical protein
VPIAGSIFSSGLIETEAGAEGGELTLNLRPKKNAIVADNPRGVFSLFIRL